MNDKLKKKSIKVPCGWQQEITGTEWTKRKRKRESSRTICQEPWRRHSAVPLMRDTDHTSESLGLLQWLPSLTLKGSPTTKGCMRAGKMACLNSVPEPTWCKRNGFQKVTSGLYMWAKYTQTSSPIYFKRKINLNWRSVCRKSEKYALHSKKDLHLND